MSRNKDYQRMLNSKQWRELRSWKLRQNPLCERCAAQGYVVAAVDCHHIRPVENFRTVSEMRDACFNPANIMSVCIPCHIELHKEMRSHTKEKVEENKKRALERFRMRNDPNYVPDEPSAT